MKLFLIKLFTKLGCLETFILIEYAFCRIFELVSRVAVAVPIAHQKLRGLHGTRPVMFEYRALLKFILDLVQRDHVETLA